MDLIYPLTNGFKLLVFQLNRPQIDFNIKVELFGKNHEFKISNGIGEIKSDDFTITYEINLEPNFNNKYVGFITNHGQSLLKLVSLESYQLSNFHQMDEFIPYKCKTVPFGKFADICNWEKGGNRFFKFDSATDLARMLRQEYPHWNVNSANYLMLKIFNVSVYKEEFKFINCGEKHVKQGEYQEFGTKITEMGNHKSYIKMNIDFKKKIVSQSIDLMHVLKKL